MNYRPPTAVIALYLATFSLAVSMTLAAHFRGGTISWKSEGGKTVRFLFKLGWTYGHGPGCREDRIGKFVRDNYMEGFHWVCSHGCPTETKLCSVTYVCTAANKKEDWEQGQRSFLHTFKGVGPFTVRYKWYAWIKLSNGKGDGDWVVATTVDLRKRSDIGRVNSSPESVSKPIYRVQFGCETILRIPAVDPDGDHVRCRWGNGFSECGSVCNALPNATLDEETCTLVFKPTEHLGYKENGIYAVALMLEDYPKSNITMGAVQVKKTPRDALSSIPLQFLVRVTPLKGGKVACSNIPRFVDPTPDEKEVIVAEEGELIRIMVCADNGNDTNIKADDIRVSGPMSSKQSPITRDMNRTNTFQMTLTWRPSHSDKGDHIVCASVTNAERINGQQRCFTIRVEMITTTTTPMSTPTLTITNSKRSTTGTTRKLISTTSLLPLTTKTTSTPSSLTTTTTTTTPPTSKRSPSPAPPTTASSPPTKITPTTSSTALETRNEPSAPTTTTSKSVTTKDDTTAKRTQTHATPKLHTPTSPPNPRNDNKKYNECRCVIRTTGASDMQKDQWTANLSLRNILTFIFGIPIGLGLSVITTSLSKPSRQNRRCRRGENRHPCQVQKCLRSLSPVSW